MTRKEAEEIAKNLLEAHCKWGKGTTYKDFPSLGNLYETINIRSIVGRPELIEEYLPIYINEILLIGTPLFKAMQELD